MVVDTDIEVGDCGAPEATLGNEEAEGSVAVAIGIDKVCVIVVVLKWVDSGFSITMEIDGRLDGIIYGHLSWAAVWI